MRLWAAFGRRAMLGVLGALLLLGGVTATVSLLVLGAGLPFDDHALDAESSTVVGEVVKREPTGARRSGEEVIRLSYSYRIDEKTIQGSCYAVGELAVAGALHPVEFLSRQAEVSRLRGTTRAMPAAFPWPWAVTLVCSGVVLCMIWLRAGIGQRQLLRDGTLVTGEVQSARRVAFVLPAQVAVAFTFRDRERKVCHGRQWCAAGGDLGRSLLDGERAVSIVHDPGQPHRNSLASPACFEAAHDRG